MEQSGDPYNRLIKNLYIILHQTSLPENTGMAIRAMANTGIINLRLANPAHTWPNKIADLTSAEKLKFINIEIFQSLQDAIADLHTIYATTARSRNMIQEIYSPCDAASEIISSNSKIGIVFGNEQFGLSNEDLCLCNAIIEIPSGNFSSYNLAQAVLIICYEILKQKNTTKPFLKTGKTQLATQQQINYFLSELEQMLITNNHFPSEEKHVLMMQTIKNIFNRTRLTSQETQSLFGVLNTLKN